MTKLYLLMVVARRKKNHQKEKRMVLRTQQYGDFVQHVRANTYHDMCCQLMGIIRSLATWECVFQQTTNLRELFLEFFYFSLSGNCVTIVWPLLTAPIDFDALCCCIRLLEIFLFSFSFLLTIAANLRYDITHSPTFFFYFWLVWRTTFPFLSIELRHDCASAAHDVWPLSLITMIISLASKHNIRF